MEIQISRQLALFGQSVLLGLTAGLLYDLLRSFRLRLPRSTALWDTLYCLAVGTGLFFFTLRRADGLLRGYVVLGALGGAVLFFCLLSPLLRPLWDFWVDTVAFFLYLMSLPLHWAENFCKKIALRGKNLFYFAGKCYTIIKNGHKVFHGKGGRSCGKGSKNKKAARPRQPSDQAAGPSASGRHRLAAVQPPWTGPRRPGGKGRPGRKGQVKAAGE